MRKRAMAPEVSLLTSVATPSAKPRTESGKSSAATIMEQGPAPIEKAAMKEENAAVKEKVRKKDVLIGRIIASTSQVVRDTFSPRADAPAGSSDAR